MEIKLETTTVTKFCRYISCTCTCYMLHVTCYMWAISVYVHVGYINNKSCRYNHVHVTYYMLHVGYINNINLVDIIMNMYMLHVGYIMYMYMHVGYINNIHPVGTIICMLHVTCGVYRKSPFFRHGKIFVTETLDEIFLSENFSYLEYFFMEEQKTKY